MDKPSPAAVEVQVQAGGPSAGEGPQEPGPAAFPRYSVPGGSLFRRASQRLRASMYRREQAELLYGPDPHLDGQDPAAAAADARAAQACGTQLLGLRRRMLPQRWHEPLRRTLDESLAYHSLFLALACFVVFAPDLAILASAPDAATNWVNGCMVACMALFAAEAAVILAVRPSPHWGFVTMDLLSNLSCLFAITWFTEAVGAKEGGTTAAAARSLRIVRLVRLFTVLELLVYRVVEWRARRAPGSTIARADQMAPSNIGRKIGMLTTFQVGVVAIAVVAGTCLLLGVDADTGSLEALQAWAEALAAAARGGCGGSAATLQPSIDAMLAFAADQLEGKKNPMLLEVVLPSSGSSGAPQVASWDWVEQRGGWTQRKTDRAELRSGDGAVWMAVDVSAANHARARYNMLLSLMVTLILLAFVVSLNYAIWKEVVQPLDRIFNTIRTNASQVIAALGPHPEDGQPAGERRGSAASSHLGSAAEASADLGTIEAAVQKMSRIIEQYTAAGGVGVNAVKKMAEAADDPTKQWLATMVAGPAQAEVAAATAPSSRAGGSVGGASLVSRSTASLVGRAPGSYTRQRKQSRLGRLSGVESAVSGASTPVQQLAAQQLAAQPAEQQAAQPQQQGDGGLRRTSTRLSARRMSSLVAFQVRAASSSSLGASQAGGGGSPEAAPASPGPSQHGAAAGDTPAGTLAAAAASPAVLSLPGASGTPATPAAALAPGGDTAPSSLQGSQSDLAALAAAARPRARSSIICPSSAASSGLSAAQQRALLQVDVDYLHSFSFDALALPAPLLPAYLCAMFLELELAFFTGVDAGGEVGEAPAGFVDVATLWAFVEEVQSRYRDVPYHNFAHCTDVTHATFMFVRRVARKVCLTPLEQFALLVAAVAHDMEHPGVNNAFLVNSRDPLATTYNDGSVLENRHVACLYGLLEAQPHLDIFARLDPREWREVRKMVIGAVLATDMVHHFGMVSRLEVLYELHAQTLAAHHHALRHGLPRDGLPRLFDGGEERQLLLNALLHCADISNPVRPSLVAEKWADRVLGEFFGQGDRERAAGLPISPMCDRGKTGRAASQLNFIEFVVAPIYAQLYRFFPELGECLDNLVANRHAWHDALAAELAGPDGTLAPPAAQELAKAEARLAEFQKRYADILARRRHKLEQLVGSQAGPAPVASSGGSLTGPQGAAAAAAAGAAGSPRHPAAILARSQSLAALLASPDSPGRAGQSVGGGGSGVLGSLRRLATKVTTGGSSGRSLQGSDAHAAGSRPGSFSSGTPAAGGLAAPGTASPPAPGPSPRASRASSRVAPDDAV